MVVVITETIELLVDIRLCIIDSTLLSIYIFLFLNNLKQFNFYPLFVVNENNINTYKIITNNFIYHVKSI